MNSSSVTVSGKGMEVLRGVQWVSKVAYKTANLLGSLILALMLIFLLAGVVFRYVLHSPLAWTDESAMILVIWMVLFGASIGVKERTHVGTESFLSLFPIHVRKIILILVDSLIAFFGAYLMVFGWKISIVGAGQHTVYWGIPYFYLYLSISIGGALLLIQAISLIIDDLQRLRG
jgi:TRAP-type transport system small permease protein